MIGCAMPHHVAIVEEDGSDKAVGMPRLLTDLRNDPKFTDDIKNHMAALAAAPVHAAE
jgi:hypothetical protein